MRLILILGTSSIDIPKRLEVPDETFVFCCFEDFSVGPLNDWDSPEEFKKNRSIFQQNSSLLKLPDGSAMDYFVWLQMKPEYDLVELIRSGVAIEDVPLPHEFDDVAPVATTIEIWSDRTVRGQVFQWYLAATLPAKGIALDRVSVCLFSDPRDEKPTVKFWSDMLLDQPDRGIPATALSNSDWNLMSRYWEAIANLPAAIDPILIEHADEDTLQAFDAIKGRHPAANTGLTNLQERILQSADVEWKNTAVVVADAMYAGWNANDTVMCYIMEDVLDEMSQMASPLIEKRSDGPMHKCQVRLTSHGKSKLSLIRK